MTSESVMLELIKQGGFALLSAVMFLLYRHDSKAWAAKQTETASAYMAFGAETARALTQVSEAIRQQSQVLETIQHNLARNHLCPVTQVSTELLREAAQAPEGGRRRVDALLRQALRQAGEPEPREGR